MRETASSPADDCFRTDNPRLSHEEARAHLSSRVAALSGSESVPIAQANGRYVAAGIVCPANIPAHTNAAVDGYAFSQPRVTADGRLRLTGRSAAGHPFAGAVPDGSAVRILTGAALPDGTDTVAMQEDCTLDPSLPGLVTVPTSLRRHANVRFAGEDLKAGSLALHRGQRLRPQDLAAAAAMGLSHLDVARQPRVAIVASGDEVRVPGGDPLERGAVYDSNSAMLAALVSAAGGHPEQLGIWPDDRAVVTSRLAAAAADFDVIVTTGGASMGDEDHMAASLATLGSRHFWQIAVKPGRPLLFGRIEQPGQSCLVVGLPGNPVAVFVCAALYVQPLLRALQGGSAVEPRRFRMPAAFSFTGRKRGRREFWRGTLVATASGLGVEKFRRDGSGLVSGLMAADGLIDIPADHGDVAPGDPVDFIPMSEFGIAPA